MRKTILIGKSTAGKTTLVQRIEELDMAYNKTQTVDYYINFIDTPGEYLENRGMRTALVVAAADADVIAFLQDCTQDTTWIPPGFASAFPKTVIGIVTKIDLATSSEQLEEARDYLELAGAQKIFEVSAVKNIGVDELVAFLNQDEDSTQ